MLNFAIILLNTVPSRPRQPLNDNAAVLHLLSRQLRFITPVVGLSMTTRPMLTVDNIQNRRYLKSQVDVYRLNARLSMFMYKELVKHSGCPCTYHNYKHLDYHQYSPHVDVGNWRQQFSAEAVDDEVESYKKCSQKTADESNNNSNSQR
jgi:hypothetical protein